MLTSNNSLSGDSTKSSGSSSDLLEKNIRLCFDGHPFNDEYVTLTKSDKDERYWDRRRKNNAAAKRSRERRRQHDMELEQRIEELKMMNSKLSTELNTLKQKVALCESLPLRHDMSKKYPQSIDKVPVVTTKTERLLCPGVLTSVLSNENHNLNIIDSFRPLHDPVNDVIYKNIMPNPMYHQNPLDLSCKVKRSHTISGDEIKSRSKPIHRNNTQVTLDQKYWDRRRRNNEAVRKCRQNKREKIVNGTNLDNAVSEEIHIKIESISNELEKLKTHFKQSEQCIDHLGPRQIICTEEVPKSLVTKIIKWKSKLIEADQADKEMS